MNYSQSKQKMFYRLVGERERERERPSVPRKNFTDSEVRRVSFYYSVLTLLGGRSFLTSF